MLTFSVGLAILSAGVLFFGFILDDVWDWGRYVIYGGACTWTLSLVCLAGCVFYYGVKP